MANVLYTCCQIVESDLRANVDLTSSEDEVLDVADSAVVIRKVKPPKGEQSHEVSLKLSELPGIAIIPGPATSPPSAGHSNADDVYYTIDLVIADRDNNLRSEGLLTYTYWQQRIRQRLNNSQGTIAWPSDASSGFVWQVNAVLAEAIEDWPWKNVRTAITGVRLQLISREPRG